jgi:ribonuclease HII
MRAFSLLEQEFFNNGLHSIAGIDEAGRGPLAGPVIAAAVILPGDCLIEGVNDSKKLRPAERKRLAAVIRDMALAVGIGTADHLEIDEINILQASILAMHRAIDALGMRPGMLLVDGNRFWHPTLPFHTVVAGDATCFSIAAASILAKVARDAILDDLDRAYPAYGFARHKGYPTRAHIEALRQHGPSPVHRRSFVVKRLAQPALDFAGDAHG